MLTVVTELNHLMVPGTITVIQYSKTCVKQPLSKRPKIGFQDQLLLNAGQKYCRMLESIAECSKVLQNAPRGAFCNTFDLH